MVCVASGTALHVFRAVDRRRFVRVTETSSTRFLTTTASRLDLALWKRMSAFRADCALYDRHSVNYPLLVLCVLQI